MDRFDLEDKITAMHNTVEELNVLARMILEQDIDKDDIAKHLKSLVKTKKVVYKQKKKTKWKKADASCNLIG